MTPTERLQAAIDRLTELRDATNSVDADWVVIDNAFGDGWFPALQIAVADSAWDACIPSAPAALIVTLHRTIDAQLDWLQSVLARKATRKSLGEGGPGLVWAVEGMAALALADAILGAAS